MAGKLRKIVIVTGITLAVIGVGGKLAFDYAADKVVKKMAQEVSADPEVQKLLKDKDVQQKLDQLHQNPDLQKKLDGMTKEVSLQESSNKKADAASIQKDPVKGTEEAAQQEPGTHPTKSSGANVEKKGNSNSSSAIHFSSTSDAAQYAMKRFSMSEINHYRQMVSDGITPEEKRQLKAVAFSRFSPAELRAFIEAARK
ncbi:hypothetical protein [Aneurinibacillus tyrosinisolvens]|uniref:hypothetical protein n=1 Tax=Aneurinibacillus tyrosinisolvens TaxID=1443435 RepID=UPI00063F8A80|nr:hypothetical protein [Aneurinibacillus tyrosinisolvens]